MSLFTADALTEVLWNLSDGCSKLFYMSGSWDGNDDGGCCGPALTTVFVVLVISKYFLSNGKQLLTATVGSYTGFNLRMGLGPSVISSY